MAIIQLVVVVVEGKHCEELDHARRLECGEIAELQPSYSFAPNLPSSNGAIGPQVYPRTRGEPQYVKPRLNARDRAVWPREDGDLVSADEHLQVTSERRVDVGCGHVPCLQNTALSCARRLKQLRARGEGAPLECERPY